MAGKKRKSISELLRMGKGEHMRGEEGMEKRMGMKDDDDMPMRYGNGSRKSASEILKSGTYKGKSNALGYGGRAAQLRDQGVPEGVIGMLARKAGAAPGQPNYHGGKK